MGFGIKLEVWGDYALFTRPEMKVERVSYDVITPSAARGLIEAIYWKPAIKWIIDKIYVCNPIKFTNIRRNEISSKISGRNVSSVMNGGNTSLFIDITADRQQRASLVLRDVRYIIEARFELTEKAEEADTIEKHYNIILRRARKGWHYHQPCFGCREFPASFTLFEGNIPKTIEQDSDLGFMLYDLDFKSREITPQFFRAEMKNGVIDLRNVELKK